jgi:hypothetical protein
MRRKTPDARPEDEKRMIQVMYVSAAVRPFAEAELVELLRVSRENNGRADITGLLAYQGGNFIQAIEGPEEPVIALHAKIQQDSRHHNMFTLLQRPITERQFEQWSMAFQNVDNLSPEDAAAHSEFLKQPFSDTSFIQEPGKALRLLLSFRRNMR